MILLNRVKVFLVGIASFVAVSVLASAEERFAIVVGPHDNLVFFGPKGDRVAELTVPTIAQTATVGDVSFQVSYGKDSSGQLTAILTPSGTAPAALHFNVLGKAVDAENAVVTLTFAFNLKSVIIDPGYVGDVEVNSHRLRRHNLAEELAPPPLLQPGQVPTPVDVAAGQPADSSAPAAAPPSAVEPPESPSAPAVNISQTLAPAPLAGQMPPSILGKAANPDSSVASNTGNEAMKPADTDSTAAAQVATQPVKLYWAEPVTGPDGYVPPCGLDEIKLVEIHGSVSITTPNGETQTGSEGMTVLSGSTILTEENSSAALFMGGVNSARLMPKCELTVTQSVEGNTRKDALNLFKGAVFSRIGQRPGEVQEYTVSTPEGSTGAQCANMLAFRGSADDVPGVRTTMSLGPDFDRHQLLAWNPPLLGRGLVSDVVNPIFGATSPGSSTIFYYAAGSSVNVNQVQNVVMASNQSSGHNGPDIGGAADPNTILQGILLQVAPFNVKLNTLLTQIDNGTATASEIAFYHNLISVFFSKQIPGISQKNSGTAAYQLTIQALLRDLQPFVMEDASPH
jgi:hypothetical protein